jgi:DNA-binding FadR family transcriptional regulator
MSISSATSSLSAYQPTTSQQNSVKQNFQQLSQALQSGDLATAQQAYATLMQSLPGQGSTSSGSQSPFQQAISSIGSALQSGDLSGAQKAMQSLQQTAQQAKGAHHGHHHHGGGGAQAADSSTSSTTSAMMAALTGTTPTISLTV